MFCYFAGVKISSLETKNKVLRIKYGKQFKKQEYFKISKLLDISSFGKIQCACSTFTGYYKKKTNTFVQSIYSFAALSD